MKTINLNLAFSILLFLSGSIDLFGQGFLNLNFESTSLSPNGPPGTVSIGLGLPSWGASIGGLPQSTILYNNGTLGASSVAILGSGNLVTPVIAGSFSAMLVGGSDGDVSLSQTELVPANASSILLDAYFGGGQGGVTNFSVTLGGQAITMIPMINNANYTVYGGDVSSYAGQSLSLQITAFSFSSQGQGVNVFVFDDIQFSPQPIPEPGTIGLLALGGLILGFRGRARNRIRVRTYDRQFKARLV
jgi:hypothetical protein